MASRPWTSITPAPGHYPPPLGMNRPGESRGPAAAAAEGVHVRCSEARWRKPGRGEGCLGRKKLEGRRGPQRAAPSPGIKKRRSRLSVQSQAPDLSGARDFFSFSGVAMLSLCGRNGARSSRQAERSTRPLTAPGSEEIHPCLGLPCP